MKFAEEKLDFLIFYAKFSKSNKRHSIIAFIAKSIGKIQIGKKKEHLRGMYNKG